jgi:DNA-binding response OmpR family regulator
LTPIDPCLRTLARGAIAARAAGADGVAELLLEERGRLLRQAWQQDHRLQILAGGLTLNWNQLTATIGGRDVLPTQSRTLRRLLFALAAGGGQLIPYHQLWDQVYPNDDRSSHANLVPRRQLTIPYWRWQLIYTVSNTRRLITLAGGDRRCIRNRSGFGYYAVPERSA